MERRILDRWVCGPQQSLGAEEKAAVPNLVSVEKHSTALRPHQSLLQYCLG